MFDKANTANEIDPTSVYESDPTNFHKSSTRSFLNKTKQHEKAVLRSSSFVLSTFSCDYFRTNMY